MRRNRGFTVIELLVAFTILSVMLAAGYGTLRASLRVYRAQKHDQVFESNVRLSWRFISRDLRCAALDLQDVSGTFMGDEHSVNFFTAAPAYVSILPALVPVSYHIDADPATLETGLVRISSGAVQQLAPLTRTLTLSYYDGKEWHGSWGVSVDGRLNVRQRMLPLCVKVELEVVRPDDPSQTTRYTTIVPVCAAMVSDTL